MLFNWKKPKYIVSQTFYYASFILHYLGVLLALIIIFFSLKFLLFKHDFLLFKHDFTSYIELISIYMIVFSIFLMSLGFLLFSYIYHKRLHIDMQVILNKLTPKSALKVLKAKEFEIPLFKNYSVEYANFGALLLSPSQQKKELYKDIDFTNIPKNIKIVFILFFILSDIALVILIFGIVILFFFHKERDNEITLKQAKKRVCQSLKDNDSRFLYLRNTDGDNYVFTKQAPVSDLKYDANNAIYVKKVGFHISTRSSSDSSWKTKLKGDSIFDCDQIK